MMIPKSIGAKDLQTNQEGKSNNGSSFSKGPSSTSKQWSSGFQNPRIVRVPRSLGGKDRHSKVSTIRGLRDRRIRLSVPTAIQLYDLQDKLGLAQPSKVIDWLLDVSKNDIDMLPPLPLGDFVQSHIPISIEDDHKIMAPFTNDGISFTGEDSKEIAKSRRVNAVDNFQSQGEGIGEPNSNNAQELHSAQSFFPLALMNHHGSLAGFPDNSTSFYNWEPSNLSLSQFGTHFLPSQTATDQDPHNNSGTAVMFQSSMPFPSLFPIYTNTPHITSGSDQRSQVNQFQLMSSTSQNIRPPFPTTLNANPKLPNGQSLLREDNNADH